MLLSILKSKIHRAVITDCNLHYEGSIGIDRDWMDEVGLLPYERVDVAVIDNGNRFTTYVIEQPRGGGDIVINGAAAHLCAAGQRIIVMGYAQMTAEEAARHQPKILRIQDSGDRDQDSGDRDQGRER